MTDVRYAGMSASVILLRVVGLLLSHSCLLYYYPVNRYLRLAPAPPADGVPSSNAHLSLSSVRRPLVQRPAIFVLRSAFARSASDRLHRLHRLIVKAYARSFAQFFRPRPFRCFASYPLLRICRVATWSPARPAV
jgi:hypothetical protein